MTELLPCPHCGSDDVGPITFKGCNGDVWDEFIVCGGCGATAETVEAWNMRAERTCKVEVRESAWGGYTRHCGNCGADLDCDTRNKQNYCPNCGRKVES